MGPGRNDQKQSARGSANPSRASRPQWSLAVTTRSRARDARSRADELFAAAMEPGRNDQEQAGVRTRQLPDPVARRNGAWP